jgi:hypothetical protein
MLSRGARHPTLHRSPIACCAWAGRCAVGQLVDVLATLAGHAAREFDGNREDRGGTRAGEVPNSPSTAIEGSLRDSQIALALERNVSGFSRVVHGHRHQAVRPHRAPREHGQEVDLLTLADAPSKLRRPLARPRDPKPRRGGERRWRASRRRPLGRIEVHAIPRPVPRVPLATRCALIAPRNRAEEAIDALSGNERTTWAQLLMSRRSVANRRAKTHEQNTQEQGFHSRSRAYLEEARSQKTRRWREYTTRNERVPDGTPRRADRASAGVVAEVPFGRLEGPQNRVGRAICMISERAVDGAPVSFVVGAPSPCAVPEDSERCASPAAPRNPRSHAQRRRSSPRAGGPESSLAGRECPVVEAAWVHEHPVEWAARGREDPVKEVGVHGCPSDGGAVSALVGPVSSRA